MVNAKLFPFLLPFPLDFGEVIFLRERLHSSMFSVTFLGFRKIKIRLNNIIPSRYRGARKRDLAERMAESLSTLRT